MESCFEQMAKEACQWVREAGKEIRQMMNKRIRVDYKSGPDDLVTEVDQKTERFFIRKIRRHYPDHRIVGEEGFGDDVASLKGIVWFIDPIDGTMNFVHLKKHFTVSVAVYEDGIGRIGIIYDVMADELFYAIRGKGAYVSGERLPELAPVELSQAVMALNATWITKNRRIDPNVLRPLVHDARGTRSFGSAALELAYVACGRIDGYITMRLSPWDFGAGRILIEEAGGTCTTIDGKELHMLGQNSVFAASQKLHEEILQNYILPAIKEGCYIESAVR